MAPKLALLLLLAAAVALGGARAQETNQAVVVNVDASASASASYVSPFAEPPTLPPTPPPCTPVATALAAWNLTTLVSLAKKVQLFDQLIAPDQTLLVPLESAFTRHFARNTTLYTRAQLYGRPDDVEALVRYSIIPGSHPTRTLKNLQRLYGLVPGVNVAVKVPPRGVRRNIVVVGVNGDTRASILRKDVPVCGGGYVHLISEVVLPYKM